jgi:glycosyltransferase involved in cell wall biosynthesis
LTPTVSVVLPVRNGGPFLAAAVESILDSTFRDLELLIVDDHSDDGAIDRLNRADARLRFLTNPDKGLTSAINHGLEQAEGRFIARMDSDDISLPGRFEAQLRYLETNPAVDIAGGRVELFSDQPLGGGYQRYQRWLNQCISPDQIHREIFIESPIPHPTVLFRRDAIERLKGYRDPDWPEDYDLFLRADALGMRMGKPQEVILKWREHGQRLTHTDSRYRIERFQAAKAHFLVQNRLQGRPVVIWGAGPTGRTLNDLLVSEGAEIRGFLEVHPRRIGGTKRDRPVWPIEQVDQLSNELVLVAVGAAGARTKIREWMDQRGKQQEQDYLFVA